MCRNFMVMCFFLSNLLVSTAQGETNASSQDTTTLSHKATIINISLEEGFIILDNQTYGIEPKIPVSNHKDLPVDPGNLSPGQKIEFWTSSNNNNQYLPSAAQGANVIKIRILSHVSQESIYH